MILSFRHRGLRDLFERREYGRIAPSHRPKVNRILGVLNESMTVTEMDLPGYRFHRLTGQLRGFYSVSVSENWRIIFRFEDGNAFDVDYVDYH